MPDRLPPAQPVQPNLKTVKLSLPYPVYIYILERNTNRAQQLRSQQVGSFFVFSLCEIGFNFILGFSDMKPEVICSFTTEFDDHIFVTVDADAFFFLHDLITSYVKEKEKVVS